MAEILTGSEYHGELLKMDDKKGVRRWQHFDDKEIFIQAIKDGGRTDTLIIQRLCIIQYLVVYVMSF